MGKRLPTKPAASYTDTVTEKLRSMFLISVFAQQGSTVGTQKGGKLRVQMKSFQKLLMQLSMQKHTRVSCPTAKKVKMSVPV